MSDGPALVPNPQGDQSSSNSNPSVSLNTSARPTGHRNRASRRPRQGPENRQSSQALQQSHPGNAQHNRRQRNGAGSGTRPDGSSTPRPSRGSAVNNSGNMAAVSEQTAQLTVDGSNPPRVSRQQRSRKFGSQLTPSGGEGVSRNADRPQIPKQPAIDPDNLDLTSRLMYSFTHKEDALDCPICFNSIHPAQPIWSCTPSPEADTCCWGTFHLKCIRSWATKSASLLHRIAFWLIDHILPAQV